LHILSFWVRQKKMSGLKRKWLSSSEVAYLSGFSERHVRRCSHFDSWRVGYPSKHQLRKHRRFIDDPDLRDFCEYLLALNSLPFINEEPVLRELCESRLDMKYGSDPANRHLSRWERYAGKRGEGLRLRLQEVKDKPAILATIANWHELKNELVDALRRHPGKDETKFRREIRKIGAKWLTMIADEKLPISTRQMRDELEQLQEKADRESRFGELERQDYDRSVRFSGDEGDNRA
jgi:hypothetical protein